MVGFGLVIFKVLLVELDGEEPFFGGIPGLY